MFRSWHNLALDEKSDSNKLLRFIFGNQHLPQWHFHECFHTKCEIMQMWWNESLTALSIRVYQNNVIIWRPMICYLDIAPHAVCQGSKISIAHLPTNTMSNNRVNRSSSCGKKNAWIFHSSTIEHGWIFKPITEQYKQGGHCLPTLPNCVGLMPRGPFSSLSPLA